MNFEVLALIERKAFGSPAKKQVIQSMAYHINEVSQPYAWPSAVRLGLKCELNERTVRRTWADLEAMGVIKRHGEKRVRGGAVIVWKIDLRAIMALRDAIPTIEEELEDDEELFSDDAQQPPGNLSGGGDQPPDTVSETPGHSVHNPRTQCPTNNSIELSTEPSTPRGARGSVEWTIEELWKAGPQSSRAKSSRKDLTNAVKAVLKKRADVNGATLVHAYSRYLKTGDPHRDGGKYALGVHRWISQHRFDAFVGEPGLLAAAQPGAKEAEQRARFERLDTAFWRYSRTGEWHGAREGWPMKPDQAPPGHYPEALYAKHKLKPLAPPVQDAGEAAA